METPKEYYYTYYSYEEWGRGYFGSRKCYCFPEEDVKYLGSSKDKTFKPTHKIILKGDYSTREDALADEIILQQYYKVVENPHFANKAYQTSTKFYYIVPFEEASERGKINGKNSQKNKTGLYGRSPEEIKRHASIGGKETKKLKRGIHGLTPEEMSENGKKGSKKTNSQMWICLETGYVSNSGALSNYQKKRSIDTSKRRRIS
jgi:hypothetical protein